MEKHVYLTGLPQLYVHVIVLLIKEQYCINKAPYGTKEITENVYLLHNNSIIVKAYYIHAVDRNLNKRLTVSIRVTTETNAQLLARYTQVSMWRVTGSRVAVYSTFWRLGETLFISKIVFKVLLVAKKNTKVGWTL